MLRTNLLAISACFTVISSLLPAFATPANVFTPYVNQIRENLPRGYEMRLPSELHLGEVADDDFFKDLIVRIFPTYTPAGGMTVGLFTCISGDHPCFVGSFSVDRENSPMALLEFQKHQATGEAIPLSPAINGYLLTGAKQNPAVMFSSLMWEQDGFIHTLSFLDGERENIILMGSSMVNSTPIRSNK
ncbi:MAG: hypothetical protein VKL59_00980 [Nostocaceae cyanobacterium]|nr:hypothetical protein [Nostocaceae cyanobacterium]